MDIRTFYSSASGIIWLFLLPFKLIRGKFNMFVTGVATPEHFITFALSRLLRKPVVVIDSHWFWPRTLPARILWPIGKLIANHGSVLAIVGKRAKKFWALSGISHKRITIFNYYYSNLEANERNIAICEQLRATYGNRKIIFFLGRLKKGKGVQYLINAFASQPTQEKLLLLIGGEGPERRDLEDLCNNLKLKNVVFTGLLIGDLKVAHFLISDIFVYPSTGETTNLEEWGVAVNEAMSLGKPIVVSSLAGCAYDLVEQGLNGYIVPPCDTQALSKALTTLLKNDALRIEMGRVSSEIIQNFTYDEARKRLEEIVEKASAY